MNLTNIKKELKKLKQTTFGISIPELKKLAKKIAKDNYNDFVKNNDFSSFELKLLHAFVIGYAKDDIDILLNHFQNFIPHVNNWAINDSLCQNFKIAKTHRNKVWNFLKQYKSTTKEFESRIVAVILLSHYLTDEYIDKVIKILNKLNTDNYYSQMGVAWAFATIMGKYPQKCLKYLQSNNCKLDKKTYNKTIQKIKESFKVSEELKKLTQKLKK